jgi:cytochrome c oxidase assembly protein subunit 15
MSRALVASAAAVLATGTVVTGAGPHSGGGQHDNVARLNIRVETAARVHGALVMVFLGLVLVTLWLVRTDRAPKSVQTRLTVLLVVLVAQAGVGYAQYFDNIPALLVGIHIVGATAVWSATVVFALGCFERTAPSVALAAPGEEASSSLART